MARPALSAVAEQPVVALCAGKDCRKRCEFAKMRDVLEAQCEVLEVKCVGLCNGPVIAIDADANKPLVYSKLRTKRQRKLVLAAVAGDSSARRDLAGRRVAKKKVVVRVAQQVKRRELARSRAA